jgi:hypothetical protein
MKAHGLLNNFFFKFNIFSLSKNAHEMNIWNKLRLRNLHRFRQYPISHFKMTLYFSLCELDAS